MCLNTTVKIPVMKGKIITKKKGSATYILYQYGSEYNQDKRYAIPQRTIVGKCLLMILIGLALVIGGEGSGVSRLLRSKCDVVLSMPMHGKVNSLNRLDRAQLLSVALRLRLVTALAEV